MQIDLDALPDDPAILQRMLREVVAATMQQNAALSAENDKLRLLIQRLTRHQFGRRSEQLIADQFQLGLEDIEQTIAENEAAQDAADAVKHQRRQRRGARPNRNLGALPAHLPRYEVVIDIESRECPCCGGALHPIDELRTEQLDIAPAQLRVRVTRRPRYACRSCEGAVVVAPAPERPIDGGMATEALLAHVVVSKFCELTAAVSPGSDAGAAGREPGSLDAQQLGGPGLLVADAALRPGARHGAVVRQAVRRRHDTAGARSGAWPDQDGTAVVLRGR